mgnify:CR=1 FL=1
MKIERFKDGRVGCAITYNANETAFIDTLTEECRKNIYRGIAIPSDYGYKPDRTYFCIDGQQIAGIPSEREQFIKFFHELETLLLSDDKKYWVLYDERYPETPWHEEYYWCIPTSEITFIRLDGEWHYLKDECTDAIDKLITGVTLDEDEDVASDNRVCLVTYLETDWNAWFMSIINKDYKYMNLTQIVWDSWLERDKYNIQIYRTHELGLLVLWENTNRT